MRERGGSGGVGWVTGSGAAEKACSQCGIWLGLFVAERSWTGTGGRGTEWLAGEGGGGAGCSVGPGASGSASVTEGLGARKALLNG